MARSQFERGLVPLHHQTDVVVIAFSRTVVSPERTREFVDSSGDRVRSVTLLERPEVLLIESQGDRAGTADAALANQA